MRRGFLLRSCQWKRAVLQSNFSIDFIFPIFSYYHSFFHICFGSLCFLFFFFFFFFFQETQVYRIIFPSLLYFSEVEPIILLVVIFLSKCFSIYDKNISVNVNFFFFKENIKKLCSMESFQSPIVPFQNDMERAKFSYLYIC